MKEFTLYCNF